MIDDPMDIDTEEYVTLADAMRRTGKSRRTIGRWVKAGQVRTLDIGDVKGFHVQDLADAEANAHYNAARTRKQ
nr:hypothetical protein [Rhodococcus sp. 15-1154-1]